ncbi:phosphoribosylformylglycinamidine synthase [Hydrogenispora ethanolica]|jgi:phosphoribosylformylglycinamidine synthase|uniref:Phosphoribosylformylglycinamidine synthase n=1 Tax=Hydrogenispora ethanolica TaxID=1082276 RepID=A0A4R1RTK9_HYDET|nr:phosphoribosylformylglycinamidine synthase [Hydrogenispora ethanolica]TCL69322.1 phosphoribosylformylglycinamidine synthase [Hydrogenispora ethanolica]
MTTAIQRIFVEKKPGFDVEAQNLFKELKENVRVNNLEGIRIVNRYDIAGITADEFQRSRTTIFAEPQLDQICDEVLPVRPGERILAVEFLPGQYDQRADSAAQCIQILTQRERPVVRVAKLFLLRGNLTSQDEQRIKEYCLNPLESREASLEKPNTLDSDFQSPPDVPVVHGFTELNPEQLEELRRELGLAMSQADLVFCQNYFRNTEGRDPSLTEIRVLDTYWSDHCRHTTFLTRIEGVEFDESPYLPAFLEAYQSYLGSRRFVHGDSAGTITLMNLATIAMKELRKRGQLDDLEESDEINACSITVKVKVDGVDQDWLVMFKNETHNHPTEIEPFGGAATCLGGAIRDPLSGRSYVYHAMRVTGSGDPRTAIADTIPGKLPQRKITSGAAAGFSAYGNQIGLATGQVTEIYDEGFIAKRMEIGAVIGAAPRDNVLREKPQAGDIIILLGGRTGRDGCGGATGSSKAHTEESLYTCGAEVQKGNPPTERKIQRLFRDPKVSRMIKKCNDFGAGGVAVAIGELAPGLEIDLDAVPKKYEGLDGTELAISESQERMAVLVAPEHVASFRAAAEAENLEATVVAVVTEEARLRMDWRGQRIVDISRRFLDSNGVQQAAKVRVTAPRVEANVFRNVPATAPADRSQLAEAWLSHLQQLNICSQRGLAERFDSTIGAGTVLMPFGGTYQRTPIQSMVAQLPVMNGTTTTGTMMSFGYNPEIAKWSPFHGGIYAVVEAVAKITAAGGDSTRIRLTLQEYFEKLGEAPEKWGQPFASLLGAYYAQIRLGIPAIGGKDSMSGTFNERTVPPTLVAFGLDVVDVTKVVSPEFKAADSQVIRIPLQHDPYDLPDFEALQRNYRRIYQLIQSGTVRAAYAVTGGGIAEAVTKMCFGNMIGMRFVEALEPAALFRPDPGAILLEIPGGADLEVLFDGIDYQLLGATQSEPHLEVFGVRIGLEEAFGRWEEPLEKVFPTRAHQPTDPPRTYAFSRRTAAASRVQYAKPRVFLPAFPGTNCEYDTQKAFERAGALVDTLVFRNLTPQDIEMTLDRMVKAIDHAQIIMLPGGFSAGDEPDGSGKFIATAFRNPRVQEAVMRLLKQRDGLILGICNGFQALIKLGLVPYGEIRPMGPDCPTLTFNSIGRHVSCLVRTRVASTLSPWFNRLQVGDIHIIPVSHGEGRFVADPELIAALAEKGQIATQYVDRDGNPTYAIAANPNGSRQAIEGITSPDGRVLGKMGHSERIGPYLYRNVGGPHDQKIFESGVEYFH